MKILLDENVPQPLASTIRTLLQCKHEVTHVIDLPGWCGTKDISLYGKAADTGFTVILTNDAKQLKRRPEVEAIAQSGVHRIQYGRRVAQTGPRTPSRARLTGESVLDSGSCTAFLSKE
ncbi:hypothetical protein GCM10029978_097210 [Actinoallomurus acanthiterrae]